jgi:hypothetical protein
LREALDMTKTYNWTTEKGAKINLVIEETETQKIWADGDEVEVKKFGRRIVGFAVNGAKYEGSFGSAKGQNAIDFLFNGQRAAVIIPSNIYAEIFARDIELAERTRKADAEYTEHHNKVLKAMEE